MTPSHTGQRRHSSLTAWHAQSRCSVAGSTPSAKPADFSRKYSCSLLMFSTAALSCCTAALCCRTASCSDASTHIAKAASSRMYSSCTGSRGSRAMPCTAKNARRPDTSGNAWDGFTSSSGEMPPRSVAPAPMQSSSLAPSPDRDKEAATSCAASSHYALSRSNPSEMVLLRSSKA